MPAPDDWDDPCWRADALRHAYYRLVSGQQQSEVEYMANGATRRVRYSQADVPQLLSAIQVAEAACAASQGALSRRIRTIRFNPTKGI